MSLDAVYETLRNENIQTVVALPDSLLEPLCRRIRQNNHIDYFQATHEAVCVGIAAGLTISGKKSLVMMENSGLRSACETIARLHLSHRLFTCYLISHRGAFGERNWWGQAHDETMEPLLKMLRCRWAYVHSSREFPEQLKQAYAVIAAGQSSAVLIAEPEFLQELKK